MNRETGEFVIYIINEVANILEKYPSEVYKVLEKTDCIQEYLVDFYDILHTMSSQKVAEDVIDFVRMRGVSI